ncbi:peptide-methionine (R)-S-oxide reductase MsrB [Cytophagales bacterium LB-30]|uniref:Peptide methionine sulfoxide reductase MsrB n=1 Tax=Shiella aurantiaca TaxID=3058365 RepID=A0ABT8F5Z0_9BACT|nr:peptide-methionine (R)-S-oxide reductase MsrB [Shiella aurantiaca]MDN4165803.1 peptide-methionine (R)-S-oxide reductase MsrB [Shiella aurantiaca]
MKKLVILIGISLSALASGYAQSKSTTMNTASNLPKTEAEWKKALTPEEYRVLREKGTERPYIGEYDQHWEAGVYVCKGCGTELFTSATKFDAGCGWPSFYEGIDKSRITETVDLSHGMRRIEVTCTKCGGHLGHVFPDGPKPTGMRYCINSVSLGFKKKEAK